MQHPQATQELNEPSSEEIQTNCGVHSDAAANFFTMGDVMKETHGTLHYLEAGYTPRSF
jgi:hypothetical protein